jgi:hypothetical protein
VIETSVSFVPGCPTSGTRLGGPKTSASVGLVACHSSVLKLGPVRDSK